MSAREGTVQLLDPLGALAGRPLTVLGAVVATLLAVVLTAVHAGAQTVNSALAALAVAVCVLACLALVVLSKAERAPLRRRSAAAVIGIALVANLLAALASWGENRLVSDDWGPIVLGILLLALSPYRPPAEIRRLTVLAAVVVAGITVLESRFFTTQLPILIFIAVAIVPLLALGFAGASFAGSVLGRLERWRDRAERASRAHAENQEEGIVRSVQQGRVSILGQDVVPLFTELLDGGVLTAEHAHRAADVADAIRAVMVAEIERSWLDELLAPARGGERSAVWASPVHDPEHRAEGMDFGQRSALRALVAALNGRLLAGGLAAELTPAGAGTAVRLHCRTDLDADALHPSLAPYLAVLRAVFDDVVVHSDPPALTLRFTYAAD
jgi:hypothetical protein